MRSTATSKELLVAGLVLAASLAPDRRAEADSCPAITRDEIISFAKSDVGSQPLARLRRN